MKFTARGCGDRAVDDDGADQVAQVRGLAYGALGDIGAMHRELAWKLPIFPGRVCGKLQMHRMLLRGRRRAPDGPAEELAHPGQYGGGANVRVARERRLAAPDGTSGQREQPRSH